MLNAVDGELDQFTEVYQKGNLSQATSGVCGAVWLVEVNWGSLKVMHLVVFLKPPGVGEVGTVRVSVWELAVRLGTLKFHDPQPL